MSESVEQNMDISDPTHLGPEPVLRSYLWTGEFADPELEEAYGLSNRVEILSRMRTIIWGATAFLSWSIFDFLALGLDSIFLVLLAGRFLVLGLIIEGSRAYARGGARKALFARVTLAQAIVCIIAPIALWLGHIDYAASVLGTLIILFAFYLAVPNRLTPNFVLSVLLSIAFLALSPTYPELSFKTVCEVALLLGVINGIGIQIVRTANRLRRATYLTLLRQKELYEQLKREVDVRREAEEAVRSTEESFQSIFYSAPMAIALIDITSFRVLQANPAALELFGVDDTSDHEIDIRSFFVDVDLARDLNEIASSETLPRQVPTEVCLIGKNGNTIWANISVARVTFGGRPSLLVGLQDVTQRHHEADALREARDEATAASRSKSEFLANMSHELRTPLNAIIGFSETIEREMFGPVGNARYREYAEDIHTSGVHLLNLINDILDLSKIEAGHFTLHTEEAELVGIVDAAIRIVHHRATQSKIEVVSELSDDTLTVVVDERAIKQVLINLLSNAVKFSPDKSRVTFRAQCNDKGIRLSVIDQGIGISEEDIPRALAPFTQLDGTLSRAHEGTGLGLPLAKHLVELHGGKLTIESVVGQGTAVHVDLGAECMPQGGFTLKSRSEKSA